MDSTPAQRAAFGAALKRELADHRINDVCDAVAKITGESVTRSAIQQWVEGRTEPTRPKVFALEEVLGLAAGALSLHLGYLPVDAKDVKAPEDVLVRDTTLPKILRESLAAAIRAGRGTG